MNPETGTAVWITWESQPRNASMARELGVPLHEFDFKGGRARRQLRSMAATFRLLRRTRPAVVFASNPSLVLTFFLLACRTVFGFRFVSDAHYGGVVAVTGSRAVQALLDFAMRRADLVIVTNQVHADRVRALGGRPFVCPDPLPELRDNGPKPAELTAITKSILFVCSYDLDEPYSAVFDAAKLLTRDGFTMFSSGRYSRVGITPESVPHVTLLGYVDRPTYEAYLRHVDIVVDFTTWADCLVCGAYESMAAGKPCVLSRTPSLTALFTGGTVFSSHDPNEIAAAVRTAYERRFALQQQIAEWVVRHGDSTRAKAASLRLAVGLPPLR